MSILRQLNFIINQQSNVFDQNIDECLSYLNELPSPKNLIHRSYLQYKCQRFANGKIKKIRNDFFSTLLILPLIFYCLVKYRDKQLKSDNEDSRGLAINIYAGVDEIISNRVKKKFNKITQAKFGEDWYLTSDDLKYISKLFPYFYSPYFLLKNIYKLAMYRYLIDSYRPNAIICSAEYSFTSSFLTYYCEQNNIKHINVMHGEKLLNIRDSFFRFHECYVWDKHYVKLFEKLRAYENQFLVAIPPSLSIEGIAANKKNALTYYLGGEKKKDLLKIRNSLSEIKLCTSEIRIRPHPRYNDYEQVKRIFGDFTIEIPEDHTVKESFINTKYIAGLYSTVLYQGYLAGKDIIIDDISNTPKFKKLKDLNYIMLSKNYLPLSSFKS